jgi:hypothetical protein
LENLLIRDPRDVAASALDRHIPGGRAYEWRKSEGIVRDRASRDPEAFIEGQANRYMKNVRAANRAYEAHGGPKVMVRYEEKGKGGASSTARPSRADGGSTSLPIKQGASRIQPRLCSENSTGANPSASLRNPIQSWRPFSRRMSVGFYARNSS